MSCLSLSVFSWLPVICVVELLDGDFFLGDDVHRAADFRVEVADHLLGAVDLELDRHGLFDRAGQAMVRRRDVAGRVAAEQHRRGEADAQSPTELLS